MVTSLLPQGNDLALLWLADLVLKVTLLLGLAGLAALACRCAAAALRHLVWRLAVAGVLVLPLLSAVLPGWRVMPTPPAPLPVKPAVMVAPPAVMPAPSPAPALPQPPAITASPVSHPPVSPAPALPAAPAVSAVSSPAIPTDSHRTGPTEAWWFAWVLGGWAIGLLVVLARWGLEACLLCRALRRARPASGEWQALLGATAGYLGLRRRIRLVTLADITVPVVCGLRRPTVILPEDAAWPEARRRVVLLHELGHVTRGDLWTQVLAQVAVALYWWHPLLWLAAHRLRVEREAACDDLVLAADVRPSEYAAHLLAVARCAREHRPAPVAGIAMARPSTVGQRIRAVLDPRQSRKAVSRWAAAVTLVIASALLVVIAVAEEAVAPEQPPVPLVTTHTLATLPAEVPVRDVVVSATGQHVAYVEKMKDGITHIVRDGKVYATHAAEYSVQTPLYLLGCLPMPGIPLAMSPDGTRLGYVLRHYAQIDPPRALALTPHMDTVMLDKQRSPDFSDATLPVFSPDGRHVAYAGRSGKHWRVYYDGVPGPAFEQIDFDYSMRHGMKMVPNWMRNTWGFSADSRHFAYAGMRGIDRYVVVDGKELGPYHAVQAFRFAGRGGGKFTCGFAVRYPDDTMGLVVDGHEEKGYRWIAGPVFSEDGNDVTFAAEKQQLRFVKSGSRAICYPDIAGVPALGFDSADQRRHIAFVAREKDARYFSVYLDHKKVYEISEMPVWPENVNRTLRFAPGGRSIIFYTGRTLHLRGAQTADFPRVDWYTFTPDGTLAYTRYAGNGQQVVIGDRAYPRAAGDITGLVFSPRGDVVYAAHRWEADGTRAGKPLVDVYVNGLHRGQYTFLLPFPYDQGPRFSFDAPDRFHFFAIKDGVLQRVEMTIPAGKTAAYALEEATLRWEEEESGQVLFTSDDLVAFDWEAQVFELTAPASKALQALPRRQHRVFVLKDRQGIIYRGTFYSPSSSQGFDGPAIQLDGFSDTITPPRYHIRAWYGGATPRGADVRFNPRLQKALETGGVLRKIPPASAQ